MASSALVVNSPQPDADHQLDSEFRAWATCTGSMLARHRLDGTFCYASAASVAVVGWSPEDLVGKKLGELLHPDDARMMVSEFGKVPSHLRPVTVTFRLLRKDGSYVWVEATAGVGTAPETGELEIITILRDVSARASIDNQVRRAQEILPSLFNRLPVLIVFLDKEGQVHYVNRYCEKLFGWSLEELKEPEAWQRMYGEPEPRAQVQRWAREPAPEIVDVRTRTREGDTVVVRWAGVKLSDGSSIGIGIDITERLIVEAALRESETRALGLNEQLLETDRRKNEFLAILAHELRNPLAPIANAIDALMRGRASDADVLRAHNLIAEKTTHLVRLVDDLLDVSRITNGIIQLDLAPCELGDVLRQAATTSAPLLERARHRFTMDVRATPVRLRGDVVRLVQVFSNLINNAAKFTPAGGHIAVSVEKSSGHVSVRVRDDGQGMAPETVAQVFDLFFHAQAQAQPTGGTMGVGLSLVRSIVELHGGSVEARSDGLRKGSEFIVTLPTLEEHAEIAEPSQVAGLSQPDVCRSHRVLVVDDDEAVAEAFAMLLDSMGHDVHVVHECAAAIDETTRFDPEIIFIDIGMPGIDGYETARRLRALPGSDKRRLVALTGFGLPTVEQRLREVGLDLYVAKPARLEELERLFG